MPLVEHAMGNSDVIQPTFAGDRRHMDGYARFGLYLKSDNRKTVHEDLV